MSGLASVIVRPLEGGMACIALGRQFSAQSPDRLWVVQVEFVPYQEHEMSTVVHLNKDF